MKKQIVTIEILSFAKYLYWSELSRSIFWRAARKYKDHYDFRMLFAVSQWYASFYVVIEGWKELKL